MKQKPSYVAVVGIWLIVASTLSLVSFLSDVQSLALARPQATPALTPFAYLPYISKVALPVPAPPPPGDWLEYVNYYRALAELPPVTENPAWSDGAWLHARYMVKNDFVGHSEDPSDPWYASEGDAAARSSNVMVSPSVDSTDEYAIDLWMQGPFHGVGVIDPALRQTGYGSYREAGGDWQMGAALDVIRGLGSISSSVMFPIMWPSDGMTVFLPSYSGTESPDPLAGCPGYNAPSGLPIILQVGPGDITPDVTAHSFMQGDVPLEHCVFDETS